MQAIRNAGGEALFVATDVADETHVKSAVDLTLARYQKIDVLCNNAGVLFLRDEGAAHELYNDIWDRTMAVNMRGYWLTSKYVVPACWGRDRARSLTSLPPAASVDSPA